MAGNTRGRLKERFEGIHKNFQWILEHCEQSLELIKQHKPELSDSIKSLESAVQSLDELTGNIYNKL